METPMFICKQDAEGYRTVLEATPAVLDEFIASAAKAGSLASRDAALMTLTNGSNVRGSQGVSWYRVQQPIRFAPTPRTCNLSNAPIGNVAYDAKTRYGGWCIMSQASWEQHGCGKLGAGFGQKYLRGTDGEFYITEGMSSQPRPYKVAA
ncbi:hypothetical protein [Roseobacter phage RDJL3]|nr:hypothetical protein [Roseobacter phage RDJL3]